MEQLPYSTLVPGEVAHSHTVLIFTGHNQYDGKKRDRKNSQDKKEKSDAFSQISLKFSFRIVYDYKHSIH